MDEAEIIFSNDYNEYICSKCKNILICPLGFCYCPHCGMPFSEKTRQLRRVSPFRKPVPEEEEKSMIKPAIRSAKAVTRPKAHLLTLEEAKAAELGWFEFWAPASGEYFVIPCVVKRDLDSGYIALDKDDFGHYCKFDQYNGSDVFCWRVWSDKPTDEERRAVPWREA